MGSKKLIWAGLLLGSVAGGYVPTWFGASWFSLWSVVGSMVGGIGGIVGGYKLGQIFGL